MWCGKGRETMEASEGGQSLMGSYMPGFLCKLLFGRVGTIYEPQFKFLQLVI